MVRWRDTLQKLCPCLQTTATSDELRHKVQVSPPQAVASLGPGSLRWRDTFRKLCSCLQITATSDELRYRGQVSPPQSVASLGPGSLRGSLRSNYDYDYQKAPGAETFTMAELARATGTFAAQNKIGQGGFGMVYKGRLRDGRMVAIKRGKKDAYEQRLSVEFRTEVEMLSQVDHLNLVKLIGYVEEGSERILVVEYVPNGNLGEHLDGSHGTVLDMNRRLDIAIDVAHALTYLHLYADRPIIHRDIKSSNILLTDTFRAKVADFGFSRVGPSTDVGATHVSTQVKGTAGYLDPEYLNSYQLNTKSDVYSFGILLIEIFTGRRPIELKRPSDERVTVRWAFRKFVEGTVSEVLDPKLERTPAALGVVERLAELAFACSAPTKADRPSMRKAAEVLWEIRKDYLVEHQKEVKVKAERSESARLEMVAAAAQAAALHQTSNRRRPW